MTNKNYLIHYGVEGQRWGVRRFQNLDGTLAPEGRKHYGYGDNYNRDNYEEDMRYLREQSNRVRSHKRRAIGTAFAVGAAVGGIDRAATKDRENSSASEAVNGAARRNLEGIIVGMGTSIAANAISNKSFEKDKAKILGALARIQNYQISEMKMESSNSEDIVTALATGRTKKANKLETKTRDSIYDSNHIQSTKNKLFELKSNAQQMDKKEFMKKLGEIEDTLSAKEYEALDDVITDVYNEKFAKRK